jgi:hypothetical protein
MHRRTFIGLLCTAVPRAAGGQQTKVPLIGRGAKSLGRTLTPVVIE